MAIWQLGGRGYNPHIKYLDPPRNVAYGRIAQTVSGSAQYIAIAELQLFSGILYSVYS